MSSDRFFYARWRSIKIAWEGIKYVLITQHNTRIHAALTLAVFLFSLILKISLGEWIALILTVGFVWSAEIFNSALEMMMDLISPDQNQGAKIIKDVSAGAVLMSVMVSILVGGVIFGPKIWNWMITIFR